VIRRVILLYESGAVYVFERDNEVWQQQSYLEASNSDAVNRFGVALCISADGKTLAVGSHEEDSLATGINGDQNLYGGGRSGAVYVFDQSNGNWQQQAYVKASNTDEQDLFGEFVSLSADGNTLAVGALGEDGSAVGLNGNQSDNSLESTGAVYLY